MKGGNQPATEPEPTGIDNEEMSNSQEGTPVPFIAGERRLAIKWISRIYNSVAKEAPAQRPSGKK